MISPMIKPKPNAFIQAVMSTPMNIQSSLDSLYLGLYHALKNLVTLRSMLVEIVFYYEAVGMLYTQSNSTY